MDGPVKHTTQPIVTGTSVLGVKFKDGVMVMADTLGSYGSLARFMDMRRITAITPNIIVAASGDMGDYHALLEILDELVIENTELDGTCKLTASEVYHYLTTVMYHRRNKMDPYWNQLVVAGVDGSDSTLGYVDLRGTHYEDDTIATGYGNYIARTILRKDGRTDMSAEEAKKLLEDSMRVMFYRDARTINRFQLATVTAKGAEVSEPFALDTDWSIGDRVAH